MRVRGLARRADHDDLLLFLARPDDHSAASPGPSTTALQLVPGGARGRICPTTRRFPRADLATGPLVDRLAGRLEGAVIRDLAAVPGERLCVLSFMNSAGGPLRLVLELFGARGLWVLLADDDSILELSRLPTGAGRELRPGRPYRFPPPRRVAADAPIADAVTADAGTTRFPAPCLPAIDAWFTAEDRAGEIGALRQRLDQAITRAAARLRQRLDGLERQEGSIRSAPAIRQQADLLLAYGFGLAKGATELRVPDPDDPGATLTYPLEPGTPIQRQAEKLYQRARKLEDSVASAARRRAETADELRQVDLLAERLTVADRLDSLEALRDELLGRGLLAAARGAATTTTTAGTGTSRDRPDKRLQKITKGHNFRQFESSEGYLILVGRTNEQNDRLSLAVARGNDLWFHVGQGHAGSHVVLRLPKGKSASLESLLDAGTLAIHFSKARQAHRCEVVYTNAKNVRKPKGLPPGKVTTTQTRTLRVDVEPERLRRLLDGTAG
jgi:predicted ribosome quality control (RQC) complex YloA/Tae2 family protein